VAACSGSSGSARSNGSGVPCADYHNTCECDATLTGGNSSHCALSDIEAPVAACCDFQNANHECSCGGYVCGQNSGGCMCQWGPPVFLSTGIPVGFDSIISSCTGTYCCLSFASDTHAGACTCTENPCNSFSVPVSDCTTPRVADACPTLATKVDACQ
jgi:hypothetical protein